MSSTSKGLSLSFGALGSPWRAAEEADPGVKDTALVRMVEDVSRGRGLGPGDRGEAEGEGWSGYGEGCARGDEEESGRVELCLPTPFGTAIAMDVPTGSSGSSERAESAVESLSRTGLLPFFEGCWPICAGDCGRDRARRRAIAESSVGASLRVEYKQSTKYWPSSQKQQ